MTRSIQPEFAKRVQRITTVDAPAGKTFYKLIRAEYVPNGGERFGPNHHILVDVWDEEGNRLFDVPVVFFWQGSSHAAVTHKRNAPYAVDFAMFAAGHAYGVRVGQFNGESDEVFGMGLGRLENIHIGHHVDYFLIYQRTAGGQEAETPTDERWAKVADLAREILALAEGG